MTPVADNPPAGTPATFRAVSPGETRRANVLCGTHREFAFAWAGKPARLRFTESARAPQPAGWLRVRLGDHSFDLGLPALPEPSALGAAFAGIELAALPEDLLLGVLEAWLEDATAALQKQSLTLQLEGWRTTAPATPAAAGWEIAWNEQPRFLAGTLHGTADALAALEGLALRTASLARTDAAALPFPVSIALARVPLPLAGLRQLGAGDVVLLPLTPADLAAGHCELWSGERCLGRALKSQRTVKVTTMSTATAAKPAPAAAPLAVDELPVQVVFDVGQVELTVGQLRTVREGYTFELPAQAERLVTVRANGREIGTGEIVDLGGKLGVRLATWSLA